MNDFFLHRPSVAPSVLNPTLRSMRHAHTVWWKALGIFDGIVILCILLFAYAALLGSLAISEHGICIDSDLATYAQAMAGAAQRSAFAADPVLAQASPANSIMNAERFLAELLAPEGEPAVGLLRAGSCILVFYCLSWYGFGLWLFRNRVYAILLLALVSVTVWVGLGTFWGIMHSDPVPRVFHAALWPWMLAVAIHAYKRVALRPLALAVAGLGIWLHGVSALNTGALFWVAFLVHKPKYCSWSRHFRLLAVGLVLFLLPVLLFLWPSLGQGKAFSAEELAVFSSAFALRWQEDYGNIPESFCALFSPENPASFILYGGLLACVFSWFSANERLRSLARMLPACMLAYVCVAVFSVLETHYAARVGRVPMGHELVRGIKFFIPLAWILIAGRAVVLLAKLPGPLTKVLVGILVCVTICCSSDRQYMAASYAISDACGVPLPLTEQARNERHDAIRTREALTALRERRKPHETVFCPEDRMMALRYVLYCPLVYSFKDGYVFFYNKDYPGMKTWLTYTQLVSRGSAGLAKALGLSQASWYLARTENQYDFEAELELVWKNADWKLYAVPVGARLSGEAR